ncbi:hypothetical protein J2R99_003285 [Rhodopseudomonas julia]|uniref:Uncharacterized protein n=1 Tax=Rhodopseudomonas julia TaxID=200617 RepID=A0ABU0CA58_9BRAD|nr:hypothetical protein [Rhodopseudomonas julia]
MQIDSADDEVVAGAFSKLKLSAAAACGKAAAS